MQGDSSLIHRKVSCLCTLPKRTTSIRASPELELQQPDRQTVLAAVLVMAGVLGNSWPAAYLDERHQTEGQILRPTGVAMMGT
jgi:hypothetical protein